MPFGGQFWGRQFWVHHSSELPALFIMFFCVDMTFNWFQMLFRVFCIVSVQNLCPLEQFQSTRILYEFFSCHSFVALSVNMTFSTKVRCSPICSDKLKTWLHGETHLLNLVSFEMCIVHDHNHLWFALLWFCFWRQFCWIIHQEINHHRSASIKLKTWLHWETQLRNLEAFVLKPDCTKKEDINFTFVKEQCIT